MRRVLAVMAGLVLLLGAAACSDDDDGGTETSAGGSATEETMATGDVEVVEVFLVDQTAFNEGRAPYVVAVEREVPADDPVQGAVDALFEGPTAEEGDEAITFVASGASGATVVSVEDGVATVQLEGGCSSGGSTLTIAAQLIPTLQQFDDVDVVKVLDPEGTTIDPDSDQDSTPECLEP